MKRWLIRLYPRWFRDRYGDEIAELLARSTHRTGDSLNVAFHAILLRTEKLMNHSIRRLADLFVVAAAFGLGFVLNDLEHGVVEIPDHWWSSFAAVVAMASVAARAALALVHTRRRRSTTT
jgi:hypothetical protein